MTRLILTTIDPTTPGPHIYTKAERAEAILACAMMASSNQTVFSHASANYFGDAIDTESRAAGLAREALWAYSENKGTERIPWAAAECLLRDGWSPGEPLLRFVEIPDDDGTN